jgi:signal transduction histidine kinase
MGDMIGNIAHQWRQPLSVISTASTGMKIQKEMNILDDESFYRNCEAINQNAQYLSSTIDDFKNFIKGDRVRSTFYLEDEINSFLNLVDGSIKGNNIDIVLNLEPQLQLDGYENELTQCLINIFNNAKDALKDADVENKLIFISTLKQDEHIVIKIKDNAGGIAPNIIDKIFEPYFTTKHQSQGTGLGLHMTYNLIVDGMDGSIQAQNVSYVYNDIKYRGAEFIIKI